MRRTDSDAPSLPVPAPPPEIGWVPRIGGATRALCSLLSLIATLLVGLLLQASLTWSDPGRVTVQTMVITFEPLSGDAEPSVGTTAVNPADTRPGGSPGTRTLDPSLLPLEPLALLVDVPVPEHPPEILPPNRPSPAYIGVAGLPVKAGGDGRPEGHGTGLGTGRGRGTGGDGAFASTQGCPGILPGYLSVKHSEPASYPPLALQKRIQGWVVLWVTVTPEGIPSAVRPHQGAALLAQEACRVVAKWRFGSLQHLGVKDEHTFPMYYLFVIGDEPQETLVRPWLSRMPSVPFELPPALRQTG